MASTRELLPPQVSGIVYASAGTGKTWLLISRVLRLLLDKVRPSSILAITFTNKAADEMRERVAERILEWNTTGTDQLDSSLREIGISDVQKYRERARRLYEQLLYAGEQLQITTFHSFCRELISSCPLQSRVPTDFQIVENAQEWQNKAIDLLFRETTSEDKEIAEALDLIYSQTRSIHSVRAVLGAFLARQNDWLSYVSDPSVGAAKAAKNLYEQLAVAEMPPVDHLWAKLRSSVTDYSVLLGAHPTKKNTEHAESLSRIAVLNELSDENFALLERCIHTTSGEPRHRKSTKVLAAALGEAGMEKLLDLCAEISATVKQMRESINRLDNYRLNRAWYIAGSRLLSLYTTLKRQHRLLDFDDLESIAGSLLTQVEYGSHWIQYRLASRIEHILIDEFQDTNPTQWQLLQPLMQELASLKSGSVFIVGDRKQSIYGFRRADPELQVVAGRWIKQHLSGSEAAADASYRSAPPIIDFVNGIFSKKDLLADFKHHETQRRDIKGGVHIFDLYTPASADKTDDASEWRNPLRTPLLSHRNSHIEEAEDVAQTIARLYKKRLSIEDSGASRAIEYRDILIVARQKTHFDVFTRALRRWRIPVLGSYDTDFFGHLEITDMLQLLAALHNPYNDLALAVVLRSPIYSLSDQHLFELGCQEALHYFTKLKNMACVDPLWRGIYEDLERWSALCARLPLHDLLYTIYEQRNLISRYRASAQPAERDQVQLHLEAFLEYTLDYDSGRYPDIARFLEHARLGYGGDISSPREQNCVRLMSIHGAKGLEAAVVFMIDCAFTLPHKDTHGVLVDWPADHLKPRHFVLMPPSSKRSELLSELTATRRERDRREEMNLLYVALTRAKQYLFISGSGKSESEGKHWYGLIRQSYDSCKSFADDPLTQPANDAQRADVAVPQATIDLKLFDDEVPVNTLTQQIEPSRIGSEKAASSSALPSEDAQLHGTLIHKALEILARQSYHNYASFRLAFAAVADASTEVCDACAAEAWALVHRPELEFLFDKKHYLHTYREMPLLYEDNEARIVYGKVDRVCVAEDSVWIIDYKTSRLPERDRTQFYRQSASYYLPQMRCYAEGVAKLFPHKEIKVSLLFTKSGFLYDYPSLDSSI